MTLMYLLVIIHTNIQSILYKVKGEVLTYIKMWVNYYYTSAINIR
jgi:hypothetical protein